MRGWYAAVAALLFLIPGGVWSADGLESAARELARKTAALTGDAGPVSVTWRNLASLDPAGVRQARTAFEAALKQYGARTGEATPAVEVRITVSENPGEYLLVEEARKGEQREVWFASWSRSAPVTEMPPSASLEKKLLWEQDEQILDAAFAENTMLLLTPSSVIWFERQEGRWARALSLPIPAAGTWPRDMRGRLRITQAVWQAYLPGLSCSGAWQAPVTLDCKASGEPWLLESGSQELLLADFASRRNYFAGGIVTQTGQRKSLPPFFSAAAAQAPGRPLWLLAGLDGRTTVYDGDFQPVGGVDSWGSSIAGTSARCGGGSQVLATRAGDVSEPDAIQAFSIVNRAPVPLSPPVEFPGPVTALWASNGASALAVARNIATGKYAAYLLTVICGL